MFFLKKYPRIKLFLAAFDFLILLSALTISFLLRYKTNIFGPPTYFPWIKFSLYLVLLIPFIFIFRLNNLYKQRIFLANFDQFGQLIKSLLILTFIYISAIFLFKQLLSEHSRSLVLLFFLNSIILLIVGRIIILRNLYKLIKHNGILKRRIIVIGAGKAGSDLLGKIIENPLENIEIVCFFDDAPEKKGGSILGVPVLGNTGDLEFYLKKLKIDIDGIYICISLISYDNLLNLIKKCKSFGYPIYLDSEHFRVINDRINIHEFESLLSPAVYGSSNYFYTGFLKRLMDVVSTVLLLVILSPLFLVISILIKITSKGPIFYKSKVVGKGEKQFVWHKFRTMKINQNPTVHNEFMYEMIKNKKSEGPLKIKDDKRITKLGKHLRRFSLDELPQLINVLKGQMSLVGPRPCLSYEYSLYEEWHKKRFSITPGITGLWQAFGRSSVNYDDMIIMDLYYIDNISFLLDLKILFKTIPTVLSRKGSY